MVSSSSFSIATNLKINLDDNKHLDKDEPDVKPNKSDIKSIKEHKRNIKMIKTKLDMNEIIYEEEKAALIYFVFVLVMKYVYFKTPTPVMSAHKF